MPRLSNLEHQTAVIIWSFFCVYVVETDPPLLLYLENKAINPNFTIVEFIPGPTPTGSRQILVNNRKKIIIY